MEVTEQIKSLIETHLPDERFYVVDVRTSINKLHSKITVLVDTDEGIKIDELGSLSRAIEQELDELMAMPFTLEVSSPGVDTPLASQRQYQKNVGRTLKVTLTDGTTLQGALTDVTPEGITITPKPARKKDEPQPQTLTYESIKLAKVVVSF